MENFMTIDQVISAAKGDIDNHISTGSFKGYEGTTDDDQENFYTITSLYAQWAENPSEAEIALDNMYEEDYPEFKELEKS